MKKWIIRFSILIVMVFIISAVWYTFPKQITKTVSGMSYQLGTDDILENIEIHIDGKFKRNFTGEKTFDGKIDIREKDSPIKDDPDLRGVNLAFRDNKATMFYFFDKNSQGRLIPGGQWYGEIYINEDFSQFTIAKYDEDSRWSESNGLMITAPASTREESINISKNLMKGVYSLENIWEYSGTIFKEDPMFKIFSYFPYEENLETWGYDKVGKEYSLSFFYKDIDEMKPEKEWQEIVLSNAAYTFALVENVVEVTFEFSEEHTYTLSKEELEKTYGQKIDFANEVALIKFIRESIEDEQKMSELWR
ncbi:DUF4825 domain-containing protein [Bacillus sp. FJAT-45066]|uniref:DUF4825 domain-containing protein n=1 Tax=Bacillus sp. FJAT-45066 TaxID=2011010 RepID=UPI000BB89E1D|nr:DUF4825 domain-containing protein [Bacillus sp. FJAT-45066]